MAQVFYANPNEKFAFPNGAVGYRSGGSFDCLGPLVKVVNCPIGNTQYRLTCYATGYADTFFSVPAVTRIRGKRVKGFFSHDSDGGIHFHPNHY